MGHAEAGRIITPFISNSGYPRVGLSLNGIQRSHLVHKLVLVAFRGPRPPGMTSNHLDGDKANPRLANLEWTTRSANQQHAYDVLGVTAPRGEAHWNAKKTPDIVRDIRRRAAAGETKAAIARALAIPRSNVSLIVAGKSWAHVT